MKKPLLIIVGLLAGFSMTAQMSKPDIQKLSKMSPAELEKYKQQMLKQASQHAKQLSAQYDMPLDETLLPDYEPKAPVKDLKRLSMIPLTPPTMMQLSAAVQSSKQQVERIAGPAIVQQVKTMSAQKNAAELQSLSIGQWMNNNPAQALLLSMESALKGPQQPTGWNNLAALYNMAGLEQKAIPILSHWLKEMPDNSMLLNNMGQAYLGLGDINKATDYLQKCLNADPMNPEANHSMGMMAVFEKQYDQAMNYFQKELQVAYRRSTMGQIKRMGRAVNLLHLIQQRKGTPHRDIFADIGLNKFHIPPLPMSSDATAQWKEQKAVLMKSMQAEWMHWNKAAQVSKEELQQEGKMYPGLYMDMANQLFSEHGEDWIHLLGLIRKQDEEELTDKYNAYAASLAAAVCPTPPNTPGLTEEVIKAYAKKCCNLHKPIVDEYMKDHNGYIRQRLDNVMENWKSYINGMVDIAQLDPSPANKRLVCKTVADYFGFLMTCLQTAVAEENPPAECMIDMSTQEADNIITSIHELDLNCPSWLNIKLDFSAVKLSADCKKYSIEGGEGLDLGYEKNFKTGVSTLSVGAGVSASFAYVGKASASEMLFISFDNNNQFTDAGIKWSAGVKAGVTTDGMITDEIGKISGTLIGVDAGYTLGLNSGFKGTISGKGFLKDVIKIETN